MQLTAKQRRWVAVGRVVSAILVLAVAALAAWLTTQYRAEFDWTASGRNSLSDASRAVLKTLSEPTRFTIYAREDRIEGRVVGELAKRYVRHAPAIEVEFVNPDINPQQLRALGITRAGTVQVSYAKRTKLVERPSEQSLSNALTDLVRARTPLVAYLTGHGERSLAGKANHELGRFGANLEAKGIKSIPLQLGQAGGVPANADLLVIASPLVALLPEEAKLVEAYIANGGNLLWLLDPGPWRGLEGLATKLGVATVPGTLVDPAAQQFVRAGQGSVSYVLISKYGEHATTSGFNLLTVLPGVAALAIDPPAPYVLSPIALTSVNVWAERGPLRGDVRYDQGEEMRGPFVVGAALTRPRDGGRQRIVVMGDGDFLSNAALGNSGNLDLGMRLVEWLVGSDALIDIPVRTDPDNTLDLDNSVAATIGLGFLFALPLAMFITGTVVWLRRRNR